MKLYFSPGACSLASHITAVEAGVAIELVRVNLVEKKLDNGEDYRAINAKGSVPALAIDGLVLTEGVAIQQYLADQDLSAGLLPAIGTIDRYRVLEWLNFIASELHKAVGGLFDRTLTDAEKEKLRAKAEARLTIANQALEGCDFLVANRFSLADVYLFVVLRWTHYHGFDLPTRWPNLAAFQERMCARESIRQAMSAEGLKK